MLFLINFSNFNKNYDDLQNGVLRMHILANSDSEADQKLKLKVRDKLLENSEHIFGENNSINDAEKNIKPKSSNTQKRKIKKDNIGA